MKICPVCKKNFIKHPHYSYKQWNSRVYCSKVCKGKALKPFNFIHNKPHSLETKIILRNLAIGRISPIKGKHLSEETKQKIREKLSGERSNLWKGGISKDKNYQRLRGKIKAIRRYKLAGKLTIQTIKEVYDDNIKQYKQLTCYLCLKPIELNQDSLEHKIPLIKGGTNKKGNLAVAHRICNSIKGSKIL